MSASATDPSCQTPGPGEQQQGGNRPGTDVVAAARALQALIESEAETAERDRQLTVAVVDALSRAGLFRLGFPVEWGGADLDPITLILALEAIAGADGSAGWGVMVAGETALGLGGLDPSAAVEILQSSGGGLFCGGFAPSGRARAVDGGVVVSGRWPFVSGCVLAGHFVGGCAMLDEHDQPLLNRGGQPLVRQVFVARDAYSVVDTWNASGLCATGSHDVVVSDVFVPSRHVANVWSRLTIDAPLFRLPLTVRLACGKAAVSSGIASHAIGAFTALAGEKSPLGSTALLRERPEAQLALAQAEALHRSTRAFLVEAVDAVWSDTTAGREVTDESKARVRLAASYCCQQAVTVVDLLQAQAGMTGIFPSSPLERAARDARVVREHAWVTAPTITMAGRVLLGMEAGSLFF